MLRDSKDRELIHAHAMVEAPYYKEAERLVSVGTFSTISHFIRVATQTWIDNYGQNKQKKVV